ncbi:MAG: hypothetical protein ACRBEE_10645 [Arenicella sp.]
MKKSVDKETKKLSDTAELVLKSWSAPRKFSLDISLTEGKPNTTVAEGVIGGTNFCKINAASVQCLNFGPS